MAGHTSSTYHSLACAADTWAVAELCKSMRIGYHPSIKVPIDDMAPIQLDADNWEDNMREKVNDNIRIDGAYWYTHDSIGNHVIEPNQFCQIICMDSSRKTGVSVISKGIHEPSEAVTLLEEADEIIINHRNGFTLNIVSSPAATFAVAVVVYTFQNKRRRLN